MNHHTGRRTPVSDPDQPQQAEARLTVAEIAEELRVNPATVRLWISKGTLPAKRAGQRKLLIRRSDLDHMLEVPAAARVSTNLPLAVVEEIDRRRGSVPRATYLAMVIAAAMTRPESHLAAVPDNPDPTDEGGRQHARNIEISRQPEGSR